MSEAFLVKHENGTIRQAFKETDNSFISLQALYPFIGGAPAWCLKKPKWKRIVNGQAMTKPNKKQKPSYIINTRASEIYHADLNISREQAFKQAILEYLDEEDMRE